MKYFKFTQISAESGISWAIAQPLSGPSLPFTILPGLNNIVELSNNKPFYIGEADDSAVANPDNYIFEITAQERAEELKNHVINIMEERLRNIYQLEKEFRQSIFSKYDESASIAGVYKYEEAKELLLNSSATAPQVRQEATIRGVDPVVLAQRIINNHESFRTKEAKIAGIRGLLFDRLTNFTFDINNPDASYSEFVSMEKIGERIIKDIEGETTVDRIEDIVVGKYELALDFRFQHLD